MSVCRSACLFHSCFFFSLSFAFSLAFFLPFFFSSSFRLSFLSFIFHIFTFFFGYLMFSQTGLSWWCHWSLWSSVTSVKTLCFSASVLPLETKSVTLHGCRMTGTTRILCNSTRRPRSVVHTNVLLCTLFVVVPHSSFVVISRPAWLCSVWLDVNTIGSDKLVARHWSVDRRAFRQFPGSPLLQAPLGGHRLSHHGAGLFPLHCAPPDHEG